MSGTIDEIEEVLIRKKEELRDRLDVRARIRGNPLPAAGLALGIGVLFGLLTGGGNGDPGRGRLDADRRAELWEARARRLLGIARVQEEEIDELEGLVAAYEPDDQDWEEREPEEEPDWEEGRSRWSELRATLSDRVGGFVADTSRQLLEGVRERR